MRRAIYISNVNGYEKNGLGFLSRASLEGELVEERWLEGIDAPTGMAIHEDRLYVANYDELVRVDLENVEIVERYPSPDEQPGLNDVAVDPQGRVFVTGSASRTVYLLSEEGLVPWVTGDELRDANGVYAGLGGLLVAGYYLNAISYLDQSITLATEDSLLVDLESIESDGRGAFFLTAIGPRPIWHLRESGSATPVLERDTFSADVEFVESERVLIVPSGGNTVTAFRVEFE